MREPAKPVGKKRPKAIRRADIIQAALDEFAARGFAQARMEDVARHAGIAKGTLYLYVSGKEELFEAVVRDRVVPQVERLAAVAAEFDGPSQDLLRMQLGTIYRMLIGTELRHIVRLLIAEAARFPAVVDFYHREVISRGMAAISATVHRGIGRGEFRATAATEFPQAIAGPIIMAVIWRLLFEDRRPLDADAYFEAHMDLLLDGLIRR